MGGAYISCGKFAGDDKSGSPILAVLERLVEEVPRGAIIATPWVRDVADVIRRLSEGPEATISPNLAQELLPRVEKYFEQLSGLLGHPSPGDAPELDAAAGLDPTDAKLGKGNGWRLYCCHDLMLACRESITSGAPIEITSD